MRLVAAVLALLVAAGAAQADLRKEWVEYSHGATKLKSYLVYDDKTAGKRPAVFLVHRRNGMDENTLKSADLYARLGYAVFAVDMFGYGQGVLPKTVPEMTAQIVTYYKDRPLMKARAGSRPRRDAEEPDDRCVAGRAHRLLLRRHRRHRDGLCRRAARGDDHDPRHVPRPCRRGRQERQRQGADPARRRGPGLPACGGQQDHRRICARPRSISTTSSTAAPITASRRRRTRPRSAPTCSRSLPRRGT